MQEILTENQTILLPHLAVETSEDAIRIVNRWLHREVGMALNVDAAEFNPKTFCWHLSVNLAYASIGRIGVVGDIYIHAGTGEFIGVPTVAELQKRADELAEARGITE